jgi:hypothetical protein
MPDEPDVTWPPAWTIVAPRKAAPPLITTDWLVKERLEEVREQIALAKLFDREWTKEYR